jgi:hypothetical protein
MAMNGRSAIPCHNYIPHALPLSRTPKQSYHQAIYLGTYCCFRGDVTVYVNTRLNWTQKILCFTCILNLHFRAVIQINLPTVPFSATIFISVVISGITLSGSRPMILEMVLELTYPIREGISLSILQLVLNLTMLIFYFIQLIPGIGKGRFKLVDRLFQKLHEESIRKVSKRAAVA